MEMLLIQDDSVLVIYLNLQMIIYSHEGGATFFGFIVTLTR